MLRLATCQRLWLFTRCPVNRVGDGRFRNPSWWGPRPGCDPAGVHFRPADWPNHAVAGYEATATCGRVALPLGALLMAAHDPDGQLAYAGDESWLRSGLVAAGSGDAPPRGLLCTPTRHGNPTTIN